MTITTSVMPSASSADGNDGESCDGSNDDSSNDDSSSSVSSADLSCSLTMPPVVTQYEVERYQNGQLTIDEEQAEEDGESSSSSPSSSKKADIAIAVGEKVKESVAVDSKDTATPAAVANTANLTEDGPNTLEDNEDDESVDEDNGGDYSPTGCNSMMSILMSPKHKYMKNEEATPNKRNSGASLYAGLPTIPTSPTSLKETIMQGLSDSMSSLPISTTLSSQQHHHSIMGNSSLSSLPILSSTNMSVKEENNSKKTKRSSSAKTSSSPRSPKTKSKKKNSTSSTKKKSSGSSKATKTESSKTAMASKATTKTASSTATVASSCAKSNDDSTVMQQQQHLPGNADVCSFLDRLMEASASCDTTIANKYGIELPVIAVMGDTSSGKSSVLSQLANIELPKAQSFTTRCPIRLQMTRCSSNGSIQQRHAVITVEWRSNIVSNQYPEFPATTVSDDGADDDAETNWEMEVANAIAEAQRFVLQHTQKPVTNDIVCVNVQTPNCLTELTVIDLPGIMRSKAGIAESESLRTEIAELQKEYLSLKRCIIVAVHAATVDWHNAQITADAAKVDPDTDRTVVVLTKPDLIDVGAEQDVADLLTGQHLHYKPGHLHMVKCRGQAALDANVSLQQGIRDEAEYFQSTEPWKSLDSSLLGTANLRQKLGDLQTAMIKRTLPGIIQEIRDRQTSAAAALEEMGNLHTCANDRRRYYHDICRTIVSHVKASLSGKGGKKNALSNSSTSTAANNSTTANGGKHSAAASLHDDCSRFRDRIEEGSLATIRKIREGGTVLVAGRRGTVRGEVVHLDDTFACVDYIDDEDKSSEILFDAVCLKAPRPIEENDVWSVGSKVHIARKNDIYDSLRKIPLTSIRTDPTWLKEKMAGNRTDDLACFLNVDSFKSIVEEFIEEEWKPHAIYLLTLTKELLSEAVGDAINASLTTDRYPPLRTLVTQQCRKASQELLKQAHKQILAHFEIEKHPYTQDKELFERIAAGRHRNLRRELEVALKVDNEGVFDTQAIKAIMDSVFERNQMKSVEDQMAEEMEIVLDAYGSVATRRVVDRTPMICWEVFRSIPGAIQDSLWSVADEALHKFMQEDPKFLKKYKQVAEELKDMTRSLETFESLV